ncbi:energy-coupling factor ABC transporter ATP-binding protein [Halostagnicola kamekurae]|uniref:Biotin transport system ATP-binding protein n=1 Tax=Halostagnicola kamekurae TaxID=619731 RepID=A0A1I6S2C7_9EURY|nr:ABC transporter ATP-binding protein [Halostagnicola kamekurae]SFS71074.1 biotin transport system ATP-binding protein [Halostagnicola kamekurae]
MIEFQSVTYGFEGPPVLEDCSLEIDDGEFVLLAGANGSGKTTLLRHCNGLLSPDSGEVLVDGVSVADDPVAARTATGMVFQHPRDQFVAATVGSDVAFGPENLGLSHAEIDRRVEDSLATVNLEGRGDERIDTLSGGEQSRVAIAGALAMDPTHLLLDEPFTGLDEPSREAVLERLEALSRDGTGVVLATHDLRDVTRLADRIVVMRGGEILEDGPPSRVVERLDGLDVRAPS